MRWVAAAGIPAGRVHRMQHSDPARVLHDAATLTPGGVVWGVGNYADMGERLAAEMRGAAEPC
jgi:hypothetical protein